MTMLIFYKSRPVPTRFEETIPSLCNHRQGCASRSSLNFTRRAVQIQSKSKFNNRVSTNSERLNPKLESYGTFSFIRDSFARRGEAFFEKKTFGRDATRSALRAFGPKGHDLFEPLRGAKQPVEKHCLQKFLNLCMIDGKKSKSHKIITNTLCRIGAQHGDVITFLMKAIDNVKPIIEVRKIRISGSTILVPCIISRNRQESLAIRWIVEAATA
jgi:Ribosomal protein S7p/S5e